MKYILNTVFLFAVLFVLSSCGEDRTHEYLEKTEENQWTYNKMTEVYLWNEEIKSPEYSQFFVKTSKFFSSLLYKDDKASFFTDTVSVGDYGMSLSVMHDPLLLYPRNVYALVLFVEPGSPAAAAGIERGTWISSANGKTFSKTNYSALISGEGVELGTEYIDFNDETGGYYWVVADTVNVSASFPYDVTGIVMDTVYSLRDKKVGYMQCNSFNGNDFESKCDEVFANFAAKDVSAVIIDLRYNSGGSIANAAYMASSLVPSDLVDAPFAILKKNNEDVDTIYKYTAPRLSLGDKKLYFITGSGTKGTAELLAASVNSSRDMYDVCFIGESTAGTNVIVESFVSPYGFKINPATAVACLPNGVSLPTTGISPDYHIDELEQIEHVYPLGSEQEYLLYNTLYHILNGFMPGDASSVSRRTIVSPYRNNFIR